VKKIQFLYRNKDKILHQVKSLFHNLHNTFIAPRK